LQAARALFPLKDGRLVLDTGEATYEVAPGVGELKPLTSGEGGFRVRVLGIMKDGSLCMQKCASSVNQDCRFLVYDGSSFRPFSESPGEIDIGSDYSTFFSSQNGDLWVSAERGTAWYHDKKWRGFSSADKTAPDSALNFIEMADGRILCATREQVWEFDGKNWAVVGRGFERISGVVRTRDGKRVAAVEVMINTPHIQELVKKGDVMGIKEAITSSGERGIQSFDVSLRDLFKSGRIELEEALASADSRANLEAKINFG